MENQWKLCSLCRILFTTRSRYENHISLEVGELNPDTLLELVGKFFPEAERKQDESKEIIDLLHGHTFAVELAARLLANGLLKPKALLTKLQKEKAAMDAEDKIGTTKDGRNRKATYHDSVTQICNYAALITDLGEPQRAHSALLKLARTVKELNSDQCLDYGLIQQVMGSVCVVKGDAAQAQLHHQRAMCTTTQKIPLRKFTHMIRT